MRIDPTELGAERIYRLMTGVVVPRPIAWVTSLSRSGVLRQAHDGAIVVLHITQDNAPRTADALPAIIDGLRARSYRLVDLSDLLDARPTR